MCYLILATIIKLTVYIFYNSNKYFFSCVGTLAPPSAKMPNWNVLLKLLIYNDFVGECIINTLEKLVDAFPPFYN